ncbi:DNA-directed RNA polymerase III subunit RPC9 [Smittium mucronatum]|uniref:DNA-directed RNA polymerase III subunit RPC9 n=1 Tax=Smittium mucronatum TaxID=133383 RepID=A0A1R0GPU4_9FUNG|nr:DNA-directed RNA polymerase III subunit RPC9 [Smittium mucronatum]OLY82316.1 DNA-directed RNA polymerase III subunit RPC9 [Smittium mucronatum]
MKVLNSETVLLSNYEVYALIKEDSEKLSSSSKNSQPGNLVEVQLEITNYFDTTPIIHQSPDQIQNCMRGLNKYSLTKAEKLQILNIRPDKEVDLYLIIEEPEERFSQQQISEILDIVTSSLIVPEHQPEEETEVVQETYNDEFMD